MLLCIRDWWREAMWRGGQVLSPLGVTEHIAMSCVVGVEPLLVWPGTFAALRVEAAHRTACRLFSERRSECRLPCRRQYDLA